MRIPFLAVVILAACGCGTAPRTLTVATFNVWGAGSSAGTPVDQTVAALEALDADIIGLQEVRAEAAACDAVDCPAAGPSLAARLAAAIGYQVFEQPPVNDALWANAILSRYPVTAELPDGLGAMIDVGGSAVGVINVHLPDYPYQPYQLAGIAYGDAPMLDDADAAIEEAERARGAWVDLVLRVAGDLAGARLTVLFGDFNEPSHLDWTQRAADIERHPLAVPYPASQKLAAAGFVDGYRSYRPDEIRHPGFTWTPLAARGDPNEHHDRIDFVYWKGESVRVRSAAVAGESDDTSEVVVTPWPSDHRAVVVTLEY